MQRKIITGCLLAALWCPAAGAGEPGINIFGLSYHYNRKTFYEEGVERDLNGFNCGLGLHYAFNETARGFYVAQAGFFKDSLHNVTRYLAAGYQWKLGYCWSAGGAVTYFDTKSYRTNWGLLPILSYRLRGIPYAGDVSINMTWFPDADRLGSSDDKSAVALFLTWHLKNLNRRSLQ